MKSKTLPKRLPSRYVHQTQLACDACQVGLDIIHHGNEHTCAYGEELYSNINERIFTPYKQKTDAMCPSHGHLFIHAPTMSMPNPDGTYTNDCGCGWSGPASPGAAKGKSLESLRCAQAEWAHRYEFCTCYWVFKEEPAMTMDERMAYERDLPFVEISNALIYETMKKCEACQNGFSQLEADHTCMYATGELDGLMGLQNKSCPTHRTEKKQDGYHHYTGHRSKLGTPGHLPEKYECEACEFETDSFSDIAGNIRATRQMVMHRMSHCTCYMVDIKTWRIKRDQ